MTRGQEESVAKTLAYSKNMLEAKPLKCQAISFGKTLSTYEDLARRMEASMSRLDKPPLPLTNLMVR